MTKNEVESLRLILNSLKRDIAPNMDNDSIVKLSIRNIVIDEAYRAVRDFADGRYQEQTINYLREQDEQLKLF